ncbi:angiotensin-converting enzyme-like [Wyeomyia smithii]|uniref:angiotensin-converting enzyme-like n=1 Tax=Wyeomyia smithii TaxID=174621 RepID=UPI00246800EB|nr:angiotensin-converting enzyme-like [Wyeomyia smithii]
MKNDYAEYVKYMNKAAGIAGTDDMGELWRSSFEEDNFVENMKQLWEQLKPFYGELHKYVRRKLMEIYGDKMDADNPNIPAHLLGNYVLQQEPWSKIGLPEDYVDSHENDINALYLRALDRVAFLPFGLLIDMWRWEVFAGEVDFADWNKRWWELREEYQMIAAPVEQDLDAFDPGAKYHIPFDSQYISYFIAHILDLQLHKALCQVAGEYEPNNSEKPLHKCDIDGSTAAGDRLRAGLQLGRSEHWSEALWVMTGETELKTDALLEYYAPLYEFLKEENEKAEKGAAAAVSLSTSLIVAITGVSLLLRLLMCE